MQKRTVKMLGKSVPLIPLVLSVVLALAGGAAIANMFLARDVGMSMRIMAHLDMILLQPDGTTELTTISLGDFYRGDSQMFPSASSTYFIENPGEANVWVSYSITGLPSGVTATVHIALLGNALQPLAPSTIYGEVAPGNVYEWDLEIAVGGSAAFDTYSPTLTWYAYESASDTPEP